MNSKTRQSGSTVVFIICAIVLSLIALGVLYGVRRVAMNDQTPPMALSDNSSLSNNKTDSDKPKTENTASDNSSESSVGSDSSQDQKANDSSSNDSYASESAGSSTASNEQSLAATSSGTGTASSADKLPTTGPEDSLVAMLGLSLMTTAGLAYVRSRSII